MAKILIIDDDQDILRLLEYAIQRRGHEVTIKKDGIEGFAAAEANKPGLIVCDVMMPKMTGYDFCRRARSSPSLKNVPIIIFTARFQPIDKRTALEAGATDYLAKTESPDALVKRIEELLPLTGATTATGAVGFFSLRGGTGVTSLVVNLALTLAQSQKHPVTVVDLALLSGHAALMLGLRPTSNAIQLLASTGGDFSPQLIAAHLVKHDSGVQLLAAPHNFGTGTPPKELVFKLMQGLKSAFALNILDVPHLLEPSFAASAQLLDRVILLLSPDMPSVQSTVVALQGLLKLGLAEEKILLVMNQVTEQTGLPAQTVEKVVKRPIAAILPYDPQMLAAVNSGKPLVLSQPQSPFVLAINQLIGPIFG
jgi:DNA-binding response OmpR family regulator